MNSYQILYSFFIYGFIGWCVEVAFAAARQRKFVNRGFLMGPICPIYGLGVGCVVQLLSGYKDNFLILYIMSVILVSLLEWVTGIFLEKTFHHRWWDYSKMPFNIQGHICIPFSLAWGVACVIIVRYIHSLVYKLIDWIPKTIGYIGLFLLLSLLIIDFYVTVIGIRQMNSNLKKMNDIADELEKVSAHLGENISRNVLDSIEKQENAKQRIEEVRRKYRELMEPKSFVSRRLIEAFPKMQSIRYKKQFQEMKDYIKNKKTDQK